MCKKKDISAVCSLKGPSPEVRTFMEALQKRDPVSEIWKTILEKKGPTATLQWEIRIAEAIFRTRIICEFSLNLSIEG